MKERAAAFACVAAALVIFAAAFALRRTESATPRTVLDRAFEAAGRGDVDVYLDCFGGELAKRLRASRREVGREAFRQTMEDRARELMGIVVHTPPDGAESTANDGPVNIRIELVFRDRNEEQVYTLEQDRGTWRITGIGSGTTVTMPIPYGTPVVPEE